MIEVAGPQLLCVSVVCVLTCVVMKRECRLGKEKGEVRQREGWPQYAKPPVRVHRAHHPLSPWEDIL